MKFQVSLFALISVMMSLTEPVWSGKGGNQDEEVSSQASKRKRVPAKNSKKKGTQFHSRTKKTKLNPSAKDTKATPDQNLHLNLDDDQNDLAQALLQLSETPAPQTHAEIIETVVQEGIVLSSDARDVRGTRPISLLALPPKPMPQQVEDTKWPRITLNLISLQKCNLYFPRDEVAQSLPRASSISPSNSLQPPIFYERAAGQRMDSQVSFEKVKQETLARIAKRKINPYKHQASRMYNSGCKYARENNWCKAVEAFTTAEWHGHKEAGRRLRELLDTQVSETATGDHQGVTPIAWNELPQQVPTAPADSIMQSWMRELPYSPHQDDPMTQMTFRPN